MSKSFLNTKILFDRFSFDLLGLLNLPIHDLIIDPETCLDCQFPNVNGL